MEEAKFTEEVFQNNFEDSDVEYIPEKHQPYYEFEKDGEKFLIGLDQILECLMVAEKVNEIPKLGISFWVNVSEKFGVDFYDLMVNLKQN